MLTWLVLHLQVNNTNWVFALKIITTTRMIERFKTSLVANGHLQILGFNYYELYASIPVAEIQLLLHICAPCDSELFQMDTITAFISAALQPGKIIYCNPPLGVALDLGSHGLRVCGNFKLLLKSLVLLIWVGLSPAVFLS
jgi:hypothetical protein